jgi:hypothetical protein
VPTKTAQQSSPRTRVRHQFDSPWKDILDAYLPQFIEFFFPELYPLIDWSKGYDMLDKELQAIINNKKMGKRFVDKLVRVTLRDGNKKWLLIHIEVQAGRETHFEKRLFVYYYRLVDRYDLPIMTLVVLADDNPSWRPHSYQETVGNKEVLRFNFETVKLLDYKEQIERLEQSDNPFGLVVAAHLGALSTQNDPQARLIFKLSLAKKLFKRGFDKDQVVKLYKFIDWVLALPEELEIRYNESIQQLVEEKSIMTYVTSGERIATKRGFEQGLLEGIEQGMEKGIEKGIARGIERGIEKGIERGIERGIEKGIERGKQDGERNLLLKLLQRKFSVMPEIYLQRLAQADTDKLLIWAERVAQVNRLEEVFEE